VRFSGAIWARTLLSGLDVRLENRTYGNSESRSGISIDRSIGMLAIGFDADDTLWHTENLYSMTQEKFRALLAPYHDAAWIDAQLFATEMRNVAHFGYGVKGFTLSMIETAIELTEGRIGGREIGQIIAFAKEMLAAPVELLPSVAAVMEELSRDFRLLLITKGDLFDQESKLARSGLGDFFDHVEIVHDKDAGVYTGILNRHRIAAADFLMVGNSLRSDILPVLAVGGQAAHVPYTITWQHELADVPAPGTRGFHALASIAEVPALAARLRNGG
jgi:putative hydrolase of the HAD superfamily